LNGNVGLVAEIINRVIIITIVAPEPQLIQQVSNFGVAAIPEMAAQIGMIFRQPCLWHFPSRCIFEISGDGKPS
jgi:hypothetical protein